MHVLFNGEKKLRAKEAEFISFNGQPGGKVDACVVVRGPRFFESLSAAADMGVPVVVVAGTEDAAGAECIRAAEECGVPGECVLVLRGGKVTDLNGKEVAPAIRGGVGLNAVLDAVKFAVANGLVPEPVVWAPEEEPEQPPEAVWMADDGQAAPPAEAEGGPEVQGGPARADGRTGASPLPEVPEREATAAAPEGEGAAPGGATAAEEGVLSPLLGRVGKVIALFQSCPGADSSSVAAGLVRALGSGTLHLEVSNAPASFSHYGASLEEAAASGKYAFCDGRSVVGAGRQELYECIVAEIRVPIGNPQVVDEIYRAAHRVVHVVGHNFRDATESVHNVQVWLDSGMGLRLDALVVDRVPESSHVVELYRGNFGDRIGMIVGIEKDGDFRPLAEALLRG